MPPVRGGCPAGRCLWLPASCSALRQPAGDTPHDPPLRPTCPGGHPGRGVPGPGSGTWPGGAGGGGAHRGGAVGTRARQPQLGHCGVGQHLHHRQQEQGHRPGQPAAAPPEVARRQGETGERTEPGRQQQVVHSPLRCLRIRGRLRRQAQEPRGARARQRLPQQPALVRERVRRAGVRQGPGTPDRQLQRQPRDGRRRARAAGLADVRRWPAGPGQA